MRTAFIVTAIALFCAGHVQGQPATFVVNTSLDGADLNPGDGICHGGPGDDTCTLRAAIMEANRAPGSTILLTGIPGGIVTLTVVGADSDDETTGDLNIRADMSIVGDGWSTSVIDANGDVIHDRAIRVEAGAVTIRGVTIRTTEIPRGRAAAFTRPVLATRSC